MEFATWFLIITMGSNVVISYKGYGGVSVTKVGSHEQCLMLKDIVSNQINATDNLYFDDDEILVKCEKV